MDQLVLAVIPARGGSKGVPNKNIHLLAEKPLIAYTIAAAQDAKRLSHCVISTDSIEIARVATEYGGDVPFMRPADLATDMAPSLPVIQHAVLQVEGSRSCRFDAVVMLQPTCPLRTSADIDAAIAILFESGADSVISVVSVGAYHPLRMKRIVATDRLTNYIEQGFEDMRPRQTLPPTYIRNGVIYLVRRDIIIEHDSFVGNDCRAYIMPEDRSVNIDSPIDLMIAEHYLQNKR